LRAYRRARPLCQRALDFCETALGLDHPETAICLNNLGCLLQVQGDLAGARPYVERALAIFDKALGAAHPSTKTLARNTAIVLEELECWKETQVLREKYGIGNEGAT
jgi:hypothetical protein